MTAHTPAATELEQLEVLHRLLVEAARAGMPLPRALAQLAGELRRGPVRRAAEELRTDLEQGASLAEAYAARAPALPAVYAAMIEAGQASGDLPGMLEVIARHASLRVDVSRRVDRALAYPVTVACMTVAVGFVILTFATPQLTEIWQVANSSTVTLWSARSAAAAKDFAMFETALGAARLALGALVAGIVVLLALRWFGGRVPGRESLRRLSRNLPLFGRVQAIAATSVFASTLSALIRREVPLPRALELAGAAAEHETEGERMAGTARDGGGIGEAVAAGGLVPTSYSWLVHAAAQRGPAEAAAALDEVGHAFRRRLERMVDHICLVVTPAGELIVGGAVLALAFGALYPVFKFIDVVLRF